MKESAPEIDLKGFEDASSEERERLSADQLLALAEAAERKELDQRERTERIGDELARTRSQFKDLRELSFDGIARHLEQLQELIQQRVPRANMAVRVEEALSRWRSVDEAAASAEEALGQTVAALAQDEEGRSEKEALRVGAMAAATAELSARLEAERGVLTDLAERVTFWASEHVDLVGWDFAEDAGTQARRIHDRLSEASDVVNRLASRWDLLKSEVDQAVER